MRIHHIGYLVSSILEAAQEFVKLGYTIETAIYKDEMRKIFIQFLIKDEMRIELISPYAKESVVANIMKKYGNSPYHICYMTENLDDDLESLKKSGYMIIQPKEKASAIDNRNVVFLLNRYIGMIELVES